MVGAPVSCSAPVRRGAVALLLAIAFGTVVTALVVHDPVFVAEFGVPGATAAMVVVLHAARQLNVSPTEAVDMLRPARKEPR
jgi:hypothetical protein